MEEITGKIRKVLSQNMWYHGAIFSHQDNFCKNGVLVDINKDTSDALDFGYGFYLAPTKERAESYILNMMKNTNFYKENDCPLILGFEFTPLVWFEEEEYNSKIFQKYNDGCRNQSCGFTYIHKWPEGMVRKNVPSSYDRIKIHFVYSTEFLE